MNIFVHGIGFHNKGAELMARAVQAETRHWDGDVMLSCSPRAGTAAQRRSIGYASHGWIESHRFPAMGWLSARAIQLIPGPARRRAGVMADSSVDLVLDASGFGYSDQWKLAGTARMAYRCRRWQRRNVPIVFLPQAFGPFRDPAKAEAMRQVGAAASLIFAREKTSYEHLREAGVAMDKVAIAPDFTSLVKGDRGRWGDQFAGRACIVPNYRMIDKTGAGYAQRYIALLAAAVKLTHDLGWRPFILFHDRFNDARIAREVEQLSGQRVDVVDEDDPVVLKGIIGSAGLVIGSRYHALINALNQGVPAVATSWSHKYHELFRDFGCPGYVITPEDDDPVRSLERLIGQVSQDETRSALVESLRAAGELQREAVRGMWERVRSVVTDGAPGSTGGAA